VVHEIGQFANKTNSRSVKSRTGQLVD